MAGEEPEEKHPHLRARHIADRIVLGGTDGIIESVAATAGLNGTGVDFRTILVAGFAFAFAGAVSIFSSSYLSRRSELESLKIDVERERMEIETEPEEEKRELEGLLRREGYGEKEVEIILRAVTKNKDLWLRAQLRHELHVHPDDLHSDPIPRSMTAGISFMVAALVPLIPYLLATDRSVALAASLSLSLVALFALGSSKFFSLKHIRPMSGIESALIGGAAAILLFFFGKVVSTFH